MAKKVAPIPPGYHSVTPYLMVRGAAKALAFYEKAFGAKDVFSMPTPDGKAIMHAEFKIGDSIIMLGDEMKEMKFWASPQQLKATTIGLHIYVKDGDRAYARAIAAGCEPILPMTDMFWGDRYGKVRDPFGHIWSIATRVKEVAPDEMAAGAEAFFKQRMGSGKGRAKASKK